MSEKSHARPYDPTVLHRLTEHMAEHGQVVSQPIPAERPDVVHNPVSVALDNVGEALNAVGDGAIAVSGMFRVFSSEQRLNRAERKAERLQHRVNVVRLAGELLDNPRGVASDEIKSAKQKMTFRGIHSPEISDIPKERDLNDFSNIAAQIFPESSKDSRPNDYRPVTLSEKRATRRLHKAHAKRVQLDNRKNWFRKTNPLPPHPGEHRLTGSEASRSARLVKKAGKLERKSARTTAKFNRITSSNNLSGKIAKIRLERVQKKINRIRANTP